MTLLRRRDLICGLAFIGLAILFGLRAMDYRLGTAARMGPGYFPLILAGVLLLLGIGVVVESLRRADRLHLNRAELRSAAAVLGSVVIFGLLIEPAGFLIAGTATAFACQLGSPRFRPVRALVSAAGLVAAAAALFIWALQLPLPLLPPGS